MFVCLTSWEKFLVHVRSYCKQTNINELSSEWYTNCLLSICFVYSANNMLYDNLMHMHLFQGELLMVGR